MKEHGLDPCIRKIPLEEQMSMHPSILLWEIPRTAEPGRLQSMESQRVRHYWACTHTQSINIWWNLINDMSSAVFSVECTGICNLLCHMLCLVTQLCPTLCHLMDSSLLGSSVHRDSPGKNSRVNCHALLQGIFSTQGSNPGFHNCRWILYPLSYQGSPQLALGRYYNKMHWWMDKIMNMCLVNVKEN